MDDFQPMKRGEWGFPAVQKPEQIEAQAQKNSDLRDAMDDEGDMLTVAWLDGFHRGKEKRPWVGLTDADLSVCGNEDDVMLARYWERVCREKNA